MDVAGARGHVVLLHGLGRSPASLKFAECRLRHAGFSTLNIGYPSRHAPLETLAEMVAEQVPARLPGRVHFLTHSMGGIVLRQVLKTNRPQNLGRVVMLGPPNRGSRLATRLKDGWIYRSIMGPAGQQIGSDRDSVPNVLGAVDFELGVIAGTNAIDPCRLLVPGDGDGKVGVDETRVEGMTDWLCLPRGHAFLIIDPTVIDQAIHFFRVGRFAHPHATAKPSRPTRPDLSAVARSAKVEGPSPPARA